MATFLELCQQVAQESGTISGTAPTSVANQTGRLAKVVTWTRQAWTQIQGERDWNWLRSEFTGNLTASTSRYTGASFTDRISGSAIARHRKWVTEPGSVTLYKTSDGVDEEGELSSISWPEWRARYRRGTQTEDTPIEYAISPANEICFGPIPSAACVVNGEYFKSAQTLSLDADIPELPTDYHDLIKWWAVVLLAGHDEAPWPVERARSERGRLMQQLERRYLPQIEFAQACTLA